MNKSFIVALALVVTSFAAHGAEPATAPIKTAQVAAAGASTKTVAPISQQDKMRECNKQATGKKGAERRAFMKTCLSRKV